MSKGLLSKVFLYLFKLRFRKIRHFIEYPISVQGKVFQYLISKGSYTLWGKKYKYSQIKTIKDFQRKIPLSTYEDIFPYIEKMMNGERDILWPGKIKWFAKSSGTTNDKSKYIPVSKESLRGCHFKGGKHAVSIYIKNFPNSKIFKGKSLFITGSLSSMNENLNIKSGDVSAVMFKNSPLWTNSMRVPHKDIALLPKWEEKANLIIKNSKKYNVVSMYGTPTWVLILIEKILKKNNINSIFDIWPNLEVFFHGAVSFAPYKPIFSRLIYQRKINYVEIYNATEGFFAVQDDMYKDGEMLLLLDVGIFYEFIPMDVFGKQNQYAVTLSGVEIDKNYAMVISTNAGLSRYIIGDTVKFVSLKPFRIKITGRTKHFINVFGEEMIVENAEQAILMACNETGCLVKSFTAGPVFMDENKSGAHEWIIEFLSEPNDHKYFFNLIDQNIKNLNSDYDAKRKGDLILGKPIFHVAPDGTFYKWMKKRKKLGGQHKIPRLSNSRIYIEEILILLKKEEF